MYERLKLATQIAQSPFPVSSHVLKQDEKAQEPNKKQEKLLFKYLCRTPPRDQKSPENTKVPKPRFIRCLDKVVD